ncbi:MAG: GGDEF domain-containing protein [Paracoccaceae bacterium]|nr:GGDEF domain-containing protein [Paracoccaceae bacterium]
MPDPSQIPVPVEALDALLPMHVVVEPDGIVRHAAPTFRKICPVAEPVGMRFLDLLEIERPLTKVGTGDFENLVGARLRLRFRGRPGTSMKGVMTPLAPETGLLVDLSFGISVVAAVAEYGLTGADFAPSDQTIEMLYLAEANAAAMAEAHRLIGRLESSRDAANEASLTDGLTGLGNRRALEAWLAARVRSGRTFSLLQVDLDYFKAVNDTHGHGTGDAVLQAAAHRLRQGLRPGDDLARIGGDEFVALLDRTTDAAGLSALAERLIAAVEAPVCVGTTECRISASIGAAVSTGYAEPTLEAMLADADDALYTVKRTGRGRARIHAG